MFLFSINRWLSLQKGLLNIDNKENCITICLRRLASGFSEMRKRYIALTRALIGYPVVMTRKQDILAASRSLRG